VVQDVKFSQRYWCKMQ